ncbi:MAG: type I-B CRISPR-associated protein Cas8b/Csh1 [Sarcina sp.]
MLKDFLEVFESKLTDVGDRLILDNYIPADGTYIIVKENRSLELEIDSISEIKFNKKTLTLESTDIEVLGQIKAMDYNSILLTMDKPIDKKKKIHSNNYLSFFVKKESFNAKEEKKLLTNEIIDGYYEILLDPYLKYKDKKSKLIYQQVEAELEEINIERLKKIQNWIRENIFTLDVDKTRKDYLKIFFDFGIEEFKKESKRYIVPNIYNKNEYNIELKGEIYGLHNNNISLNSKKPYLENKTRYEKIPYLIDSNEVLMQKKAFDYLMNLAVDKKFNIFFNKDKIEALENGKPLDDDEFSGHFFRIQRDTTVNIIYHDVISSYSESNKKFVFENFIEMDEKLNKNIEYGIKNKKELQNLLNEVLFGKCLINNYFSDIKELKIENNLKNNLRIARESIFNWIYKNDESAAQKILDKLIQNNIKDSIEKGYLIKACNLFNLRYSLLNYFNGGNDMGQVVKEIKDILREKINSKNTEEIQSDLEYYFAVGQMVGFLGSKSKALVKSQSFVNAFINTKNDRVIKEKIRVLYKKYNYDILGTSKRISQLYALILSYSPDGKINEDIIIAGYLHSNLIFEKKDGE